MKNLDRVMRIHMKVKRGSLEIKKFIRKRGSLKTRNSLKSNSEIMKKVMRESWENMRKS